MTRKLIIVILMVGLSMNVYASSFKKCESKTLDYINDINKAGEYWKLKDNKNFKEYANKAVDKSLFILDNCKEFMDKSYGQELKKKEFFYRYMVKVANMYNKEKLISKSKYHEVAKKVMKLYP